MISSFGLNRFPHKLLRSYKRQEEKKSKIGEERSSIFYIYFPPIKWLYFNIIYTKEIPQQLNWNKNCMLLICSLDMHK